jgi:hypothetical protein
MSEQGELFKPKQPSELVQKFLSEHPQVNWTESLGFLADNYPQREGDIINWVVEGGVGVSLLRPQQRPEPNDLDILTRKVALEEEFANSGRFDVKDIKMWFEVRGLSYTPELAEYVFSDPAEIEFQGAQNK